MSPAKATAHLRIRVSDTAAHGGRGGLTEWICHRARLLDLRGWVAVDAGGAEVAVTGLPTLIDAMEVACSLGPAHVLIDGIDRRDGAHVAGGRAPGARDF